MKSWQRYWLYLTLFFFSFHLLRDILQDLGIKNIIATTLVKTNPSDVPWWYWIVFSHAYVIEGIEIVLSTVSLLRNKFGVLGNLTILMAGYFAIAWVVYWYLF